MKIPREKIISLVCAFVSLLILRGVWELLALQGGKISTVFPAPTQFIGAMIASNFQVGLGSQSAGVGASIWASLYRVIIGLAIGMGSALLVGSLLSTSVWIKRFIMPIIQLFAPIAPIAWISMALVLFGIGDGTAIFIVFMGVFFFLTLITVKAIETTPKRMLHLSKNLGNSNFQTWYLVILPHILPSIFTMMRVNFMAARMAVLAAEMTGLRDGLGAIIMTGRNLFNYEMILFGMLLIAVIGLLIDSMLSWVQRRYVWWDTK